MDNLEASEEVEAMSMGKAGARGNLNANANRNYKLQGKRTSKRQICTKLFFYVIVHTTSIFFTDSLLNQNRVDSLSVRIYAASSTHHFHLYNVLY